MIHCASLVEERDQVHPVDTIQQVRYLVPIDGIRDSFSKGVL